MKLIALPSVKFLLPLLLIASAPLGAVAAPAAPANPDTHAEASHAEGTLLKADAAGVSAEWLKQARAAYPLNTCVVSEEKLEGGGMGGAKDYVYRREGQPDQLVRFCCLDCVKDFTAAPAKYLAVIAQPKPVK